MYDAVFPRLDFVPFYWYIQDKSVMHSTAVDYLVDLVDRNMDLFTFPCMNLQI